MKTNYSEFNVQLPLPTERSIQANMDSWSHGAEGSKHQINPASHLWGGEGRDAGEGRQRGGEEGEGGQRRRRRRE